MTKAKDKSILSKTKGQIVLERILLAICLCVIAVRATYTESAGLTSTGSLLGLTNEIESLIFTSVLLIVVVFWFVQAFLRNKFYYRSTGIEVGLVLFVVAAFLGIVVASDRRAAVTDFVTKLVPLLMAILLVQILDSQPKIRLVLVSEEYWAKREYVYSITAITDATGHMAILELCSLDICSR